MLKAGFSELIRELLVSSLLKLGVQHLLQLYETPSAGNSPPLSHTATLRWEEALTKDEA